MDGCARYQYRKVSHSNLIEFFEFGFLGPEFQEQSEFYETDYQKVVAIHVSL
jgi:hypothetical protein